MPPPHTFPSLATARNDRGCSVASLKGTYAYRRTGVNNGVGGPIAEIGIDVLTETGRAASFARPEAPTVKSKTGPISRGRAEATRSIRIVPGRSSPRMVQKPTNLIVLVLDGGKRFSVLSRGTDTIVTSEGIRLEVKDKD